MGLALDDGVVFWRRSSDFLVVPLLASGVEVDAGSTGALLSGSAVLPRGVLAPHTYQNMVSPTLLLAPMLPLCPLSFSVKVPLSGCFASIEDWVK